MFCRQQNKSIKKLFLSDSFFSTKPYSHNHGSSKLSKGEKYTHPYSAKDVFFPHKKLHFCVKLGLSDLAPHKFSDSAWVISTERLALYNTKAGAVSLSYHTAEISIFLRTYELKKKIALILNFSSSIK